MAHSIDYWLPFLTFLMSGHTSIEFDRMFCNNVLILLSKVPQFKIITGTLVPKLLHLSTLLRSIARPGLRYSEPLQLCITSVSDTTVCDDAHDARSKKCVNYTSFYDINISDE